MDVKQLVIEAFTTMLEEYTAQNNRWKCKAYRTALNSLKNVPHIKSLDDIKDLSGFGKKLTEHVKEIIETHEMKNAKNSKLGNSIKELMSVHGVGIQAARKMAEQNICSVKQLRLAYADKKIKLTDAQIYGLKHYDDMHLRIPFKEMQSHEKRMLDMISELSSSSVKLSVVGSYRRHAQDSGDIDMLITDPNKELFIEFIEKMEKSGYFFDTLAKGTVKYNGFCKLPGCPVRRVDVLYTEPKEYGFALLYFTGSGEFNKEMRAHALKMGYSLNQRNIIDTKSKTTVNGYYFQCEEDIFDFLDIPYLLPPKRTHLPKPIGLLERDIVHVCAKCRNDRDLCSTFGGLSVYEGRDKLCNRCKSSKVVFGMSR